ncbi:copper amine oxidase [Paenibacillus albiflavus]|uniref:Copper amine oxidase n=1 Tax=Paenibacillus albiflavus TaxID=2545760 RepID=A0A4R4EC99_9BACL|nr:CAP-associated domain-containing protein [Paenibacillus albiflavus]TCZ76600.1 copper amine oxidase [Paenibacillus albiflavus]
MMNNLKIITRKSLSSLIVSAVISTTVLSGVMAAAPASAATFTDIQGHWAQKQINWGVEHQITAGYQDGTFRPNQIISEPEFLAMVIRSAPELSIDPPKANEAWYRPYYHLADEQKWPVSHKTTEEPYTRGEVAKLIAAVMGKNLSTNEAIQYLLDQGLANGKSGNTVAGYQAADTLTRAEAMTFVYTLHNKQASKALAFQGITIGDTEESVIAKRGTPDRKDITNDGYTWYIYNHKYEEYAQIGIADGTVVALYSNANGWASADGIAIGTSQDQMKTVLGQQSAAKAQSTKGEYTYQGNRLIIYYDTLDSNRVNGIMLIAGNWKNRSTNTDAAGQAIIQGYERQLLDLTNVFRLQNGISTLQWNETAATAARKHSTDMMANHFFDHVNPQGQSVKERLAAVGLVNYSWYGENISAGYSNAIEAYAGWVNSSGHRKNMLNSHFETLGVGAALGDSHSDYDIYYTQNFYTTMH